MNRNRYRIIFNQSRGQLMAVAENVSSQSKSAGETEGTNSPSLFGSSRLFKISNLTLAFALGISSFNSSYAEIIADRNAPANQQATILRDAVGKPLVNIQTPSAAGVSRNTYTKFDVDAQGVTLNNDRGSNPWLAKGDARVILNEVNSSNPSLLAGAITVRGSRAEVIVANPSGINVNGVSIENASRFTLTTGKAITSDGRLTGIQVSQGSILVEGAGLNATGADYAELLSRTASIQAKISANQLAVTTGTQKLDYDSGTLSTEGVTGAKPGLAIDVGQLGGMYAGKISLLATEAGIGVRNAGALEASQIVLTADGKLENTGKIEAAVASLATVSSDIENHGAIKGRDFLMVAAGNNINLSGVGLQQDSGAVILLAKSDINLASGTQIASSKAGSSLSLTAGRDINLANQSGLASQGTVQLNSDGKLNSSGASIKSLADNVTVVAGSGIDLQASQINASKKTHLETGKPFAESNAAVSLNGSTLNANEQINVISTGDLSLSNRSTTAGAAHVVLLSERNVRLSAGTQLDVAGNLFIKAGESVQLQGDIDTAQKVALAAGGQIDIHGASAELQASQIRSTGANSDINISVSKGALNLTTLASSDFTRAEGVKIDTQGRVNISTLQGDLSVGGAKINGQKISLVSAGHLGITGDEMAASELVGKQGLTLATVKGADSLLYSDGRVKLDAGTGELWLSASGSVNISGHNLQTVDSQGVVATAFTPNSMHGASVRIDAKSDIDVSGADVTATAGDIGWYTKGNFNFTSYGNQPAEYGLNGNSRLNASGNVRIHADANASVSGTSVSAGKNLALTSASGNAYLDNSLLQAGDVLSIATSGSQSHTYSHLNGGALLLRSEKDKINVLQSQLKTSATLSADVAELSGQLSIDAAGTLEWDAASLISASTDLSLLAGSGDITLNAANTGNLQAGRDLAFSTGSGNLTLAAGFNWSANRDLSLKSKSGKLTLLGTAGNQGSPSAQIVTLKAAGAMSLTGAQVDIQASKLSSNGAMKITSTASDVYINGIKNSVNNYVPTQRIQHMQNQVNQIAAEIKTLETPEYILLVEQELWIGREIREGLSGNTGHAGFARAMGLLPAYAAIKEKLALVNNKLDPLRSEKGKFDQKMQVLSSVTSNGAEHLGSVINASEIHITSQQGIDIAGASIQASGQIKLMAAGLLPVNTAGKTDSERLPSAINITSLLDYYEYGQSGSNNYSWAIYNVPSLIKGDAGVTIQATGAKDNSRIVLSGAQINAERGKVHLQAEGDIRLEASQEEFYSYASRTYETGRWWNRKNTTETITVNIANVAASSLNGQSILVKSGGSIDAYATEFNAPRGNINLVAANALGMWAVQEKDFKNVDENTSRSFWKLQTGSSSSTDSRTVSSFLPSKLVAERIATDSGWDTRLQGTIFQSSLAGAVIQAGVGANARADAQIILEGIKTTIETSKTSESDSVVWQKKVGEGSTVQTMALPTFTGPTAPVFSAPGGITVQIPDGELKTQVNQLVKQPGMEYLQTLSTRNDVNWQPVKLAYDHWQYEQEGLTQAGAALVAIAVAAATGGAGLAGTVGLEGTVATAFNAAVASLATQASITLINNKGDIGQTLRDLGRSDTVKAMLVAAVTAGVLDKVSGLSSMKDLQKSGQFTDKLTVNLVNSSTSSVLNTAINGGSLEDALKSAALSAVVSTAHGEIAGEIKGLENEYLLHKLAHAAAGCAAGAAVGGECRDGAIGSAVGEMTAELFENQRPGAFASQEQWDAYDRKVLATSKIVSGALTAYTGGNAQTAINTAETAVQNNYLSPDRLRFYGKRYSACQTATPGQCGHIAKEMLAENAATDQIAVNAGYQKLSKIANVELQETMLYGSLSELQKLAPDIPLDVLKQIKKSNDAIFSYAQAVSIGGGDPMAELGAEAAKDLATRLNIPEDKAQFILMALSAGKSVGAKALKKTYAHDMDSRASYTPNANAIGNMKAFLNSPGFGSQLGDASQRTHKLVDGETIYRANKNIGEHIKAGDQFYLDKLHKDHLEVFDSKGKMKIVVNLDGSYNEKKTIAAKGRNIQK